MNPKEWFRTFFEKSSWGLFWGILCLLGTVVGVAEKALDINAAVAAWLTGALYLDPKSKEPALHLWFLPIEFLFLVALASLLFLVVITIRRQYVPSDEAIAFEGLMASVRQIVNQGKQADAIKAWDSVTIRYLIKKDLSGSVVRESVVRAVNGTLHFWENVITASDEAEPVSSLATIQYSVRDKTGSPNAIVHLPSENQGRRKTACLFFLPPVSQGGSRRFEISFHWPGLFRRLRYAAEEFEFKSNTRGPLRLYRIEVYLEDSFGKSLLCENTGPSHRGETLVASEFADATGWKGRGYVYEARDVPAGDAHFILKVDLPR